MYCKKCGCRLKSGAGVCPECGSETTAEYCGGFWGIINEKGGNAAPRESVSAPAAPSYDAAPKPQKSMDVAESAAPVPVREAEVSAPESDKRSGGFSKALSVLLLMALLFGLVQSVRLAGRPSRSEVRELKGQIEDLEDDKEVLEDVNDKLRSKNKKLSHNYKELKAYLKEEYGVDWPLDQTNDTGNNSDEAQGDEAQDDETQDDESDGGQAAPDAGTIGGQSSPESEEQE